MPGEVGIAAEVRDLARRGDPACLERLYDAHAPALHRFLSAFLGEAGDADEALQRLFVRLARNPRRLLRARRLDAWLFLRARGEALDLLRERRRRRARFVPLDAAAGGQTADGRPGPSAGAVTAAEALARLPEAQRAVVALKVFEGCTFAETAARLGIRSNTAASRYRYAMERLKAWFTEEKPDGCA